MVPLVYALSVLLGMLAGAGLPLLGFFILFVFSYITGQMNGIESLWFIVLLVILPLSVIGGAIYGFWLAWHDASLGLRFFTQGPGSKLLWTLCGVVIGLGMLVGVLACIEPMMKAFNISFDRERTPDVTQYYLDSLGAAENTRVPYSQEEERLFKELHELYTDALQSPKEADAIINDYRQAFQHLSQKERTKILLTTIADLKPEAADAQKD